MPAILFVDDNEEILTHGKLFLEGSGTMTVDTVTSPTMAIERLKCGKYDAILSDYNMPVMNGIEFLHYVRNEYGDIPFIIFTHDDTHQVFTESLEGGADYCIVKSFEPKHQFVSLGYLFRHIIELKRTRDKQRIPQEQEK